MSPLKQLALALAALALASSMNDAQAGWNRRISDVRIVHPPGTPPGMWRATATIIVENDGAIPNANLEFDCLLEVNGVALEVWNNPIQGRLPVCGGCTGICYFSWGGSQSVGWCGSAGTGCLCGIAIEDPFSPFFGSSTALVRATITPSPGALAELITSDDSMTVVIGENDPGTLTCAGDGTGTACPCANTGASGHGCANSSNPTGAQLSATGFVEPDLITGNDSVVLHVAGMPSGAPLLYFQGTSNALHIPFGDGTLCTTGSIIRLRVKINVGGASQFPEPGDPSLSTAGGVTLSSGATLYYQAYYRDAAPFCTPNTFNMTNGISLTWY